MSQIILPKFPNAAKAFRETPNRRSKSGKVRRSKAEWLARYAVIPVRPVTTAEESAKQRALFERHDAVVLQLRLPLPPTANNYKIALPNGRLTDTTEARAYFEAVDRHWQRHHRWNLPKPLCGRLRLLLVVCMARNGGDISNRVKLAEDAMTQCGVWEDDGLVDDLRVIRGPVAPPFGFIDVTIETIL